MTVDRGTDPRTTRRHGDPGTTVVGSLLVRFPRNPLSRSWDFHTTTIKNQTKGLTPVLLHSRSLQIEFQISSKNLYFVRRIKTEESLNVPYLWWPRRVRSPLISQTVRIRRKGSRSVGSLVHLFVRWKYLMSCLYSTLMGPSKTRLSILQIRFLHMTTSSLPYVPIRNSLTKSLFLPTPLLFTVGHFWFVW